jgi:hypothetical protein
MLKHIYIFTKHKYIKITLHAYINMDLYYNTLN